jgi:hypothetical protein
LLGRLPLVYKDFEEPTTTRKAGGLNFRPSAEKAKARQCFIAGWFGFFHLWQKKTKAR